MSANTKIVVLRSKELIYTTVLVVIGILVLLIVMSLFSPSESDDSINESEQNQETTYIPGVYSSTLTLGNNNLQLQVTVDSNHINDISLINLSEAITTMYPLVEPTLKDLSAKIIESQSIENISYPEETKYTSIILLNALEQALQKASK